MEYGRVIVTDNNETEKDYMIKIEEAAREWDCVQEIVPVFSRDIKNQDIQCEANNSLEIKSANSFGIDLENKKPFVHNLKDTSLVTIDQVIEDFKNQDLTLQKTEAEVRKDK